jgi:GTP-binding protein Era
METMTENESGARKRCGFVAVLGAPNAGKSTLVNALVGQKVSIVTQKVQTTRIPVRGIAIHGDAQIVFVDTPGIFAPKRRLDRAMVQAAWTGAHDADAILVVADAPELSTNTQGLAAGDTERIIEGLKAAGKSAALVLNKVDAMRRDALLPLAERLNANGIFDRIFMISATRGEGLNDLLDCCAARMPEGPFLYPEDQAADIPSRLLAAEITREKLYLRLHDELPYASTVTTESWKDQKDGSVRIDQTIFVEREGQKGIVIGKGGRAIKAIGEAARLEMEQLFGRRVHLFLHSKVAERWGETPAHYREWGLDFPKD